MDVQVKGSSETVKNDGVWQFRKIWPVECHIVQFRRKYVVRANSRINNPSCVSVYTRFLLKEASWRGTEATFWNEEAIRHKCNPLQSGNLVKVTKLKGRVRLGHLTWRELGRVEDVMKGWKSGCQLAERRDLEVTETNEKGRGSLDWGHVGNTWQRCKVANLHKHVTPIFSLDQTTKPRAKPNWSN